jgi:hypothetical protein
MKELHFVKTMIFITGLILSVNAVAEIYTWTDINGKVHFSDKVIANENFTIIKLERNNNIANPFIKDSQWQRDYEQSKAEKTKQAEEQAKRAKKNKAYCDQVKRRLAIINYGGRIYEMSPDGERNYQSEAQLTKKKKKLTKAHQKNCK